MPERRVIELTEYQPAAFSRSVLSDAEGEGLWRQYSSQMLVEFPSPKTANEWRLTGQGWVGFIPYSRELGIVLRPRVPLENLFGMWAYAYRLRSVQFPEGLVHVGSIEDFYSKLAGMLADRVLRRLRQGVYRAYRGEADLLPYVRGRMDIQERMRVPWKPNLLCHYQEHTADLEENQILAWTLYTIARSGLCRPEEQRKVRAAFTGLRGMTSIEPFSASDCLARLYDRLNDDYEPMHALCRFFLAHAGPTHATGDNTMLPFLFDMPRLFELFVAEWLIAHQPPGLQFEAQRHHHVDRELGVRFDMDLVLKTEAGEPLCVLDTKYKVGDSPKMEDLYQVLAYALSLGCTEAVLVYPVPVAPFSTSVGGIRVRALGFPLDGDLESAGHGLLAELLLATDLLSHPEVTGGPRL